MKILVVDDNKNDRKLLHELLTSRHYEVSEAGNGIEALVSVEASKPDLIISDVMMPGMDGFTLLRELKKNKESMDIPLVFYTAHYETDMDKDLAMKLGASRYIVKPTRMENLIQEIESVLREYDAGLLKPTTSVIHKEEEYLREYSTRVVKKLEDNIANLEKEIKERMRVEEEQKQTLTELARAKAELEQFVHLGSRDMQQPLKTVYNNLELICKRYHSKFEPDDADLFVRTKEEVSRMQKRNNDLIAFSRVVTRFEKTECESVLERVLETLRSSIKKSGAVVTHDPLPVVMADDMQIVQLFHNLIDNSIKFRGTEKPRIHIRAEKRMNEWQFSFKDNGIGIDPEVHDRIFLISQNIYGKEKQSTGMGLAICKKIVERHGGRIWVDSKKGAGSTFYFTIPANEQT